MAIFNRYKNILKDLVDSSDIELWNILRPVYKGPCNVMPGSENSPTKLKLD